MDERISPPNRARFASIERLTGDKWRTCLIHREGASRPLRWVDVQQIGKDARDFCADTFGTGVFRVLWGTQKRKSTMSPAFRIECDDDDDDATTTHPEERQTPAPAPAPASAPAAAATQQPQQRPQAVSAPYHAPMIPMPFAPPPGADPSLVTFVYIEALVQQRNLAFMQLLQQGMALQIESERQRSRESTDNARQHYLMMMSSQKELQLALTSTMQRPDPNEATLGEIKALVEQLGELDEEADAEELAAQMMREPSKIEVVTQAIQHLAAIAGPVLNQWKQAQHASTDATVVEQSDGAEE